MTQTFKVNTSNVAEIASNACQLKCIVILTCVNNSTLKTFTSFCSKFSQETVYQLSSASPGFYNEILQKHVGVFFSGHDVFLSTMLSVMSTCGNKVRNDAFTTTRSPALKQFYSDASLLVKFVKPTHTDVGDKRPQLAKNGRIIFKLLEGQGTCHAIVHGRTSLVCIFKYFVCFCL